MDFMRNVNRVLDSNAKQREQLYNQRKSLQPRRKSCHFFYADPIVMYIGTSSPQTNMRANNCPVQMENISSHIFDQRFHINM